jgi:hypothetical protein
MYISPVSLRDRHAHRQPYASRSTKLLCRFQGPLSCRGPRRPWHQFRASATGPVRLARLCAILSAMKRAVAHSVPETFLRLESLRRQDSSESVRKKVREASGGRRVRQRALRHGRMGGGDPEIGQFRSSSTRRLEAVEHSVGRGKVLCGKEPCMRQGKILRGKEGSMGQRTFYGAAP